MFGISTRLPNNTLNPVAMIFGGIVVLGYYAIGPIYWIMKRNTEIMQKLGLVRYAIVSFLLLSMGGVLIKIILRLAPTALGMNPVKYVWVTPWFNI
jgi:hypothetical protein